MSAVDRRGGDERIDPPLDDIPVLENWVDMHPWNVLIGEVFNHPAFDDGTPVITAPVRWMNHARADTYTRQYRLGNEARA